MSSGSERGKPAEEERGPEAPSSSLADFVLEIDGLGGEAVEERLGEGYVRLGVAEAERRQAVHDIRWVEDALIELLRNARDAHAASIYVASSLSDHRRKLTVADDGSGIPEAYHELVFEPRVTSKLHTMLEDSWGVHGRGMALYSIRERSIGARVAFSAPGLGTSIVAEFDTRHLGERKDQSSWPTVTQTEGDREFRGPKNLIRTCVEFALEAPKAPKVYLGSAAQIVATIRARAKAQVSEAQLLFETHYDRLPIGAQLLAAPDAAMLAERAAILGFEISERNAHRILSGSIRPLRSVAERLKGSSNVGSSRPVDLERERRRLKLSDADTLELKSRLKESFQEVAQRYYVRLLENPTLSVNPDRVQVTFKIALDDED